MAKKVIGAEQQKRVDAIQAQLVYKDGMVAEPKDFLKTIAPAYGTTADEIIKAQDAINLITADAKIAAGTVMFAGIKDEDNAQANVVLGIGRDRFEMVITKSGDEVDIVSEYTVIDTQGHIAGARDHLLDLMRNSAKAEAAAA